MGAFLSRSSRSSSQSQLTPHDRALLSLKIQRDRLKQTTTRLNDLQVTENEIAKMWIQKGDRRRAGIAVMKRKKRKEMVEKVEVQIENIEEMVNKQTE